MSATFWQLVPVEWVRRYKELQEFYTLNNKPGANQTTVHPEIDSLIYEDKSGAPAADPLTKDFAEILGMFHKKQQRKAGVILKYVEYGGGMIDVHKRLIYPENGQIGSSLYELVQYTMIPAMFKRKRDTPIDFVDFARLLESAKAPSDILALTKVPVGKGGAVGPVPPSTERHWLSYRG
jgi:hypothetical protein